MTITNTPRLALSVDALGEGLISGSRDNWLRVDSSGGVLSGTVASPVPNSVLYDGCLVAEKDTGKSWRCKDNGAGGFNKILMNYPYTYVAFTNNWVVGVTAGAMGGWETYHSGLNSSAADKEAGTNAWKAPVKGLYSAELHYQMGNVGSAGNRKFAYAVNNVDLHLWEDIKAGSDSGTWPVMSTIHYERVFNAGDTLRPWIAMTGGGLEDMYLSVFISMIRPLQ